MAIVFSITNLQISCLNFTKYLRLGLPWPSTIFILLFNDDNLSLVETGILNGVVGFVEVFICVTQIFIPKSHICVDSNFEHTAHFLLYAICK